jgi:hypothetical protein
MFPAQGKTYLASKIELKFSLCLTKHHAMEMYWGSEGIAPRILDLGTRWRLVVSFTPWPFTAREKTLILIG